MEIVFKIPLMNDLNEWTHLVVAPIAFWSDNYTGTSCPFSMVYVLDFLVFIAINPLDVIYADELISRGFRRVSYIFN